MCDTHLLQTLLVHHSASVQGLLLLHNLQHHSSKGWLWQNMVKFCCVLQRETAPGSRQCRVLHLQSHVRNGSGLPLLLEGTICSLNSFHLQNQTLGFPWPADPIWLSRLPPWANVSVDSAGDVVNAVPQTMV